MGSKQRRSIEDEQFLQTLLASKSTFHESAMDGNEKPRQPPQPLPCLIDARTKVNVAAAKMKGGGYEADATYVGIRMFFTTIESIGVIQDGFLKMMSGSLCGVDVFVLHFKFSYYISISFFKSSFPIPFQHSQLLTLHFRLPRIFTLIYPPQLPTFQR